MATVPPLSLGEGGPPLRHDPPHPPEPIPRRYTVASFDNLIVLANYEERLREARRMVWRDRGEPAVEVHDLWECLEHGFRGGLRTFSSQNTHEDTFTFLFSGAGTLAFAIRSGVNLILLLTRIRNMPKSAFGISPLVSHVLTVISPRRIRISLVNHALFGKDSVRFGAMLGL